MTQETDRRPWGFYEVLAEGPDYKVKRISVYAGKRLSLQKHHNRTEHWFVIQGRGVVTRDKEEIPVEAGKAVDIDCGLPHRISNHGEGDLVFIEVQLGDYCGEDDIERLEDDFGRK